jgi:hypothetical protein
MATTVKMRKGGVIVSAESDRVAFMLQAGYEVVREGPAKSAAPEAVDEPTPPEAVAVEVEAAPEVEVKETPAPTKATPHKRGLSSTKKGGR